MTETTTLRVHGRKIAPRTILPYLRAGLILILIGYAFACAFNL